MRKLETLFLTLLISGSLPALAGDDIEEIVVTADFRPASELLTAQSVSVITDETIKARAAEHFEDLVNSVPNVNFAGGTGRARFFQIRGIGERSQFVDPINPSVGLLIDNVDFSGAGSIATMLDVDQVEILRGPQGTRYGANALAGLINIKTKDPEDQFSATLSGTGGQFDTRSLAGVVTGPVGSDSAFRIAAEQYKSDGYTHNAFLNRDDVNARDEFTLRGKLRIDSDNWRTNVTATVVDVDDGYDAFSLDNTRTTLSDQPGHDRQKSRFVSVDSVRQFQPFDLRLIAGVADSDMDYGYDEDWTYAGFDPNGYSSTDDYMRNRKTRSFEARIVSNDSRRLFSDSTSWVVGMYLLDSDEDLHRVYTFLPADFFSTYEFTTSALFFQLDTSLGESTELSSGLRLERRDTRYRDSAAVAFDPRDNMWGGQLTLKHYLAGDMMVYLGVSRGYKAGGFNTDGTLDVDLRQFGSEYLWEFEGGIKGTLLDDRAMLRASVFYDLRRDQQVKSSIVRVRSDGSTEFIDFVGNAAKGRNVGMEVETDWYLSDTVTLFASIGLLRARFDEFINEFGEDLSGRDQAHAPRYSYNAGIHFERNGWFWRLAVDGKDDFYFSDRHALKSTPYTLLNARLGYDGGNWTASIWGRNLTDKDYFVRGFGSFGNDPRNGYMVEPYLQFGEPRIVGASFEYRL